MYYKSKFKIFAEKKLGALFEENKSKIEKALENEPEEGILNSSERDFIEKYYKQYYLEIVELDFENYEKEKYEDKVLGKEFPDSRYDVDSNKEYNVLTIIYCFSFTGNPNLFYYMPSKRILWTTEAYIKGSSLCFEIRAFSRDPEIVKGEANNIIGEIKKQLQNLIMEVNNYNDTLRNYVKGVFNNRRKRVQDNQKFFNSL